MNTSRDVNFTGKDILDEFPELWSSYFGQPDSFIRNKLVEHYMPLAKSLAAHYFKSRVGGQADYNDYLHHAVIGLIQAIEKYKPNHNAKFTTYASYRIKGQILNSLTDFSEKNSQIFYAAKRKKELLNSLASMDADDKTIKSELNEITSFTLNLTYSLFISDSLNNDEQEQTQDLNAYTNYEIQDIVRTIKKLLELVPHKQKLVLEYYYYYELNYSDIADILGITKGRVSQLHMEAIHSLKSLYKDSLELNNLV